MAYQKGVVLDFSRPGKPTDNAFIESFNGKFRAECLNAYRFPSLDDARAKMKEWRRDYNESPRTAPLGTIPRYRWERFEVTRPPLSVHPLEIRSRGPRSGAAHQPPETTSRRVEVGGNDTQQFANSSNYRACWLRLSCR